jgi:hypothetical protein
MVCWGGIALVFLGLLNLAARYCVSRGVRLLTIAANVIGVAYGLCIIMVVPDPQAFAALAILIALLAGAIAFHRSGATR